MQYKQLDERWQGRRQVRIPTATGAPQVPLQSPTKVINVLLVDDHALIREGLRRLLELEEDIKVVGEAIDGFDAIHKIHQLCPDVVLMDISLPITHIPQFRERKNRIDSRQDQAGGEFSDGEVEGPKPAGVLVIPHECAGDQCLQSIEKSSAW